MNNYTLELERILWAISRADRWDTIVIGCAALQNMRKMVTQFEDEKKTCSVALRAGESEGA